MKNTLTAAALLILLVITIGSGEVPQLSSYRRNVPANQMEVSR